jgi:glycosyltransferase involved in cell wall biosynthesis
MKIVLIGHGKLPIPPKGWGGVERVIYDCYTHLTALGHEVEILNVPHRRVLASLILRTIRKGKADVIWCHNERPVPTVARFRFLLGNLLVETCHSAMTGLDMNGLTQFLPVRRASRAGVHLSLHPSISEAVMCLNPKSKILPFKIGVDVEQVRIGAVGNGKAVCLGRVSARKRQRIVADELSRNGIPIEFIGPEADDVELHDRVSNLDSYRGLWTRDEVCERLTEYSALVLWSASEVQPGVIIEAFAAGLDVVVSRESTCNLDLELPFVHVVDSIEDLAEVTRRAIQGNAAHRAEIRKYAGRCWDWSAVFKDLSDDLTRTIETRGSAPDVLTAS